MGNLQDDIVQFDMEESKVKPGCRGKGLGFRV